MKITLANLIIKSLCISLFCLNVLVSSYSTASEVHNYQSQLELADKAQQDFSKVFYSQLVKTSAFQAARFSTVLALFQAVESEKKLNNTVKANALIIRNQYLLTRDYDEPEVMLLIKQLLDNNALHSAQKLIKTINEQGDDSISGQLNYLLADFSFQRKAWPKVLIYLKDNIGDLPIERYHHALLMKGVSLQKQGKHHRSIKAYEKVALDSQYYTAAQFNIALANIRQGWWTDAHKIISQLLASQQTPVQGQEVTQEKTLNRLYISLGYSMLNQAYYRNARKTFQLVGLDSRYSNQALLGIALTAAHQDDYIGALNATRFLKNKQQDDLPIDEAYLLMPFFHEKSQQLATASLGYSQASSYYQDKINTFTRLINSPLNFESTALVMNSNATMTIEKIQIDLVANYPMYFFTQRQNSLLFNTWLKQLNNSKVSQSLTALNEQYNALTIKMAKSIMQNRVAQLNSYLNQSRYGLARLYDNNTVEQ